MIFPFIYEEITFYSAHLDLNTKQVNDFISKIKFKGLLNVTMIDDLTNLVKKAKVRKDNHLLLTVHEHIIEILEYLKNFKRTHKGSETFQIRNEIKHLEELNLLVFHAFGDIHRNTAFRLRNQKLE